MTFSTSSPLLKALRLFIIVLWSIPIGHANQQNWQSTLYFIDAQINQKEKLIYALIDHHDDDKVFHLFSHARSGTLFLDGLWLEEDQIAQYIRDQFLSHGPTIKHINIYGCEFAKGKKGRAAVAYLEKTLDVSIAASDDITGIDGDWDLEVGAFFTLELNTRYPYNLQNCCPCPEGYVEVPGSAASGNADAITLDQGVFRESNALGAPDGSYAGLNSSGPDILTLDLTDVVPSGETLVLTIAGDGDGSTDRVSIATSPDNSTWSSETTYTVGPSTAYADYNHITLSDAKYVRLTWVSDYVRLDAVSYNYNTSICQLDKDNDGIPNINDFDDDNDGILDTDEGFCGDSFTARVDADNAGWTFIGSITAGIETHFSPVDGSTTFTAVGGPEDGEIVFAVFYNINTGRVVTFNRHIYYTFPNYTLTVTADDITPHSWTGLSGIGNEVAPIHGYIAFIDVNGNGTYDSGTDEYIGGLASAINFVPATSGDIYVAYYDDGPYTDNSGFMTFEVTCLSTDTDSDGTPDYLDLDSDGDGCPDALEGDGSFTYADIQNDTLIGDVDSLGIPLLAAGGQDLGSSRDSQVKPCKRTITTNLFLPLKLLNKN